MAIVKSNYIGFTTIDNRGDYYERPLGTLESSLNMMPSSNIMEDDWDDGAQYFRSGAWVPRDIRGFDSLNNYHSGLTTFPKYMSYLDFNSISAGVHGVTIDDDASLRVDGVSKLALGGSFSDVYSPPVRYNNTLYIGIDGSGGAGNNGLIKVTATSGSWVAQTPTNMSLVALHKGRIYGARFSRQYTLNTNVNRLYYSDGTASHAFLSDTAFHDIREDADIFNVFTLGNELFTYHSRGFTRTLGDPVNGFTNDDIVTFDGGTPTGGKVDGFYDLFMFSIGSRPYIFNGREISETLNGIRTPIFKAASLGGNTIVASTVYKEAANKFRPAWYVWDMDNQSISRHDMPLNALSGTSTSPFISNLWRWGTASYYWRSGSSVSPKNQYALLCDGGQLSGNSWNALILSQNGFSTVGNTVKYNMITNPIGFINDGLPRETAVVAQLDTGVTMKIYASPASNTRQDIEPTWISGVEQYGDVTGQNRYLYAFPEKPGKYWRYKVTLTYASATPTARVWGIEPSADVLRRLAV